MAAEQKFPLSLIVRAIDQASGPLTRITAKIKTSTAPLDGLGKKFGALGDALNVDGFMKVGGAVENVGAKAFGVAALLGGLTIAAGLAFGSIVHGAMEAGDQLGENALRVGWTVDNYAAVRFAAEQADVPQEMFAASLDKLNKQMGDFKAGKGGEFLAFLNEISPTFAKQMKAAKGSQEGLALLTDAFAKIDDPTKRATLAAHAFGKSNAQMGTFLAQGWGAISKTADEYMRLHGSSEALAKGGGDLDNATRETMTAFLGLRDAAAGALFPALTKLSNVTTAFLVKHREGISVWAEKASAAISAWVDSGGFDRLVGFLGDVATGAGKVVDFLGPMGVAVAAGAILFAPLIAAVASLAVAVIGVLPVVIALGPAFSAVFTAVTGLVTAGVLLWQQWDTIEQKFKDVGNTLRWALVDGWAAVRPIINAMSVLPGFGAMLKVGDFAAGQASQAIEASTGQSVDAINARQSAAEAARPRLPGADAMGLTVSFDNMPKGVTVTQDAGARPIDMSLGYSLAGGI